MVCVSAESLKIIIIIVQMSSLQNKSKKICIFSQFISKFYFVCYTNTGSGGELKHTVNIGRHRNTTAKNKQKLKKIHVNCIIFIILKANHTIRSVYSIIKFDEKHQ